MTNIIGQMAVQIGDEAAGWGNNSAPTLELSGIMPDRTTIAPSIVSEVVRAARGGIVPGRDTINVRHLVEGGNAIGGYVIYEQIPYFLEMLAEVSPTGSGPYTYTYAAPTSAQVVPHPQTLVVGYGDAVYGVTSACASELRFEWSFGQPLMFTANLMGYNVVPDAFAALDETAAASLTYALASQCTVYIDAIDGTLGSTAFSEVNSGSITITPNRKYKRRSGSLYPAGVYDSPYWDARFELVLEETSTSAGFADAVAAGATTKLVRIKFTNGGATTAERSLTFDFASILRVPSLLDNDDDMTVYRVQGEPVEEGDWTDAGAGEIDGYFEVAGVNNTSALY
jgi:hypothetical protein